MKVKAKRSLRSGEAKRTTRRFGINDDPNPYATAPFGFYFLKNMGPSGKG
jgi:hypothetical protein